MKLVYFRIFRAKLHLSCMSRWIINEATDESAGQIARKYFVDAFQVEQRLSFISVHICEFANVSAFGTISAQMLPLLLVGDHLAFFSP